MLFGNLPQILFLIIGANAGGITGWIAMRLKSCQNQFHVWNLRNGWARAH